jgi:hypothetical protein
MQSEPQVLSEWPVKARRKHKPFNFNQWISGSSPGARINALADFAV